MTLDWLLTILSSVFSPSIHRRPVWVVAPIVSVCLHTHMYSNYFMEICEYIAIRLSRSFHKVTFDSFSSSAPSILMPGRHGREAGEPLACVFSHNPPWLLIHMHSGKPHWSPSLLRLNLLLIPKVSILSEQMKFCFSQNTFFLILTADLRSRSCKEWQLSHSAGGGGGGSPTPSS